MASKTSKWMAVAASAAISAMMGGAAFAAPASALEGSRANGLLPHPIGQAEKAGPTTASEGQRQVRQVTDALRSPDGAFPVITGVLGKGASKVGTTVSVVKGQARAVVSQAS